MGSELCQRFWPFWAIFKDPQNILYYDSEKIKYLKLKNRLCILSNKKTFVSSLFHSWFILHWIEDVYTKMTIFSQKAEKNGFLWQVYLERVCHLKYGVKPYSTWFWQRVALSYRQCDVFHSWGRGSCIDLQWSCLEASGSLCTPPARLSPLWSMERLWRPGMWSLL